MNSLLYTYFQNEEGERRLNALLSKIKQEGRDREYDCLMGVSGGLDSVYLAYLGAVKWGLRIYAIHVNDGFNTEIAEKNIKDLCEKAKIHLDIITPDSVQFNDLTRAYLFASVPNIAVPQDNLIFSHLYKIAKEKNIKSFLSGTNFALECILENGNTHGAFDVANIKDIYKKFGRQKRINIPLMSLVRHRITSRILNIETFLPLNFINYNREDAIQELHKFSGFTFYGAKHLENHLTAFAQLYWLPKKFGVDKRKSHLSSMIISGQLSRMEALEKIKEPLCKDEYMDELVDYIKEKLELTDDEFNQVMRSEPKQHTEYRISLYNQLSSNKALKSLWHKIRKVR